MGTNQVAPLYWVAIALARPGPVPAHTILVPIRTDHCQNKTIARAELLRNYYEIHGAVLFPLECSLGEPSSWRHAFICGGRATTTCMNLPCLCFALICRVVARSGGDRNRRAQGNKPTCTCRPRPAGSGGVGVGATSSGRASTKLAEGDFGGLERLPSRIHVQVRRGHVSPHEHGADHAPAAPFTASPGSPPPAFHKERMPGLIRGRQPANLNICSWAPPHLPTGEGTDDNWNMPRV